MLDIKSAIEFYKDGERTFCIVRNVNHIEIWRGCISEDVIAKSDDGRTIYNYTFKTKSGIGFERGDDYAYLLRQMFATAIDKFRSEVYSIYNVLENEEEALLARLDG